MIQVNSKGNAIAIVLAAVVITTIVVVTLQNTPPININNQQNSTEKLMSEFENSIEKGFKNSTYKIMKNGFSTDDPIWFYNKPTMPSLKEFDKNFTDLTKKEIEELLKELKNKTGYEYDPASLKVELKTNIDKTKKPIEQIKALPEDKPLDLEINVLATVKEGDQEKQIQYTKTKKIPANTIKTYKKLAEWMETDMKHFEIETASAMDEAGYCQVALCDCTSDPEPRDEEGNLLKMIDEKFIKGNYNTENIKPKYEKMLQTKIDKLNQKLTGTGITCTYEIEKWETSTDEYREQQCVEPKSDESLQRHCKEPGGRWQNIRISETLDKITVEELYNNETTKREPNQNPQQKDYDTKYIYYEWQEMKEKDTVPKREKTMESNNIIGEKRETNPKIELKDCGKEKKHKDELVALNPKLYAKVAIKCNEPQELIGTSKKEETATTIIKIVTALEKTCQPKPLKPNPPLSAEPTKCLGANSAPIIECEEDIDCIPEELRDPKITGSSKGGICTKFWCEKDAQKIQEIMERNNNLTKEQYNNIIKNNKGVCKQEYVGIDLKQCPGINKCNKATCSYIDESGNLYPNGRCKLEPVLCQGNSTSINTCGAPLKCDESKGCIPDTSNTNSYLNCTENKELYKGSCITPSCVCDTKECTRYKCISTAKNDLCPPTNEGISQYCNPINGLCERTIYS
jgi:hypothetical protein